MIEEDENQKDKPTEKEVLALKLFDKNNPEMITKIGIQDLDKITILKTLVEDENKYREVLYKEKKLPKNIMSKVLENSLVLRTSLDGWRSEQAVKIITSILEDENKKLGNSLGDRLKSVIGR